MAPRLHTVGRSVLNEILGTEGSNTIHVGGFCMQVGGRYLPIVTMVDESVRARPRPHAQAAMYSACAEAMCLWVSSLSKRGLEAHEVGTLDT